MRKKTVWGLLAAALISGLVLAACTAPAEESAEPAEASVAEVVTVSGPSAPADPGEFRADSAERVAATGNPQLVEFFAYWCTVCQGIRPTIHSLEAEYWGEVDFVYLDIDDAANEDLMEQFNFVGQPLLVVIDAEGNEMARWYGAPPEAELRDALDSVAEKS